MQKGLAYSLVREGLTAHHWSNYYQFEMMSSAGGYPPIDTTTPGHAAPIPLVSTIQAVR